MAMPESVKRRRLAPEVMDDPSLDPRKHAAALRGLRRINALSGSIRIVWPAIAAAVRRRMTSGNGGPLRLIDIACGGGDIVIAVKRKAERAGLGIDVIGCDFSDVALDHARIAAEGAGVRVAFERHDALADPLTHPLPHGDVVMSSLFLHHLTETEAVTVLRRMRDAAGDTVLINDLRRSGPGFAAAMVVTRLLSRSPVVHADGPRSVQAAWTLDELAVLATRAGMPNAVVKRCFPWRMRLEWTRA